jgi:hypothetical protein
LVWCHHGRRTAPNPGAGSVMLTLIPEWYCTCQLMNTN